MGTPVKVAQAKFVANEIARVKALRPDTHIFCPCDFNTHIRNEDELSEAETNRPDALKQDSYTQFRNHLEAACVEVVDGKRRVPVSMTRAYKDVLGRHPDWTCVKTREWPDHKDRNPNQPSKIGTTSNGIDYVGHCTNSVTLAISNLTVPGLPTEDYWKSFPSAHSFSDHGVPLVVKFALTGENRDAQRTDPWEATEFTKDVLKDMRVVKQEANKRDVDIRTRIIMREFNKTLGKHNWRQTSFTNYTADLKKWANSQKNFGGEPTFLTKIKDHHHVKADMEEQVQYLEKFRECKLRDLYAQVDALVDSLRQEQNMVAPPADQGDEKSEPNAPNPREQAAAQAEQERLMAAAQAEQDLQAAAEQSAERRKAELKRAEQERAELRRWLNSGDQKFMWYKHDAAREENLWMLYGDDDQKKLYRAFMIDGENECQVGSFTVKRRADLSDPEVKHVQDEIWKANRCPKETCRKVAADGACDYCRKYPTWGSRYWDKTQMDETLYCQKTLQNGFIRPVKGPTARAQRRRLTAKHVLQRRRLTHGARTPPALAALMEKIEEAERAYDSRCR